MKAQNYLALDLGAESGRAIVGTLAAGKLTLTETHRFANQPVRLQPVCIGMCTPVEGDQERPRPFWASFSLESLALDTWGVDFALLDGNRQLAWRPLPLPRCPHRWYAGRSLPACAA